jgi:excisionase family DNA binding protein
VADTIPLRPSPTDAPPAPAESSPLLLIAELAGLLRVDRRTVERWASRNIIPGRVQLGRRLVRYRRVDVEKWIAEGCPLPPQGKGHRS